MSCEGKSDLFFIKLHEYHPYGACFTNIASSSYVHSSMQIYDSTEDDLKLNDIFEFVGVLTFDPEVTPADKEDSDELENSFCQEESAHLPPSKVLTVHRDSFCFVSTNMNLISTNPPELYRRVHNMA